MFMRLVARVAAVLIMITAVIVTSTSSADAARQSGGGGGTSRSCLTSAAQSLLNRIESRFGAMRIVSTCRPGATVAGSGRPSRHASGNAIDFDAGNRKGGVVRWLVANHSSGGTMTYSGMSHIHVDVGPRFVSLAGGTRYASNESRSSRTSSRSNSAERTTRTTSRSESQRTGRFETVSASMGLGMKPRAEGP